MMRWILLATLVVVISAAATVAVQFIPEQRKTDAWQLPVASNADKGPKPLAVVDEDLTYKFEAMAQNETIKRDWTIKNRGEGDLLLHQLGSTCSCTVAQFPDHKGEVRVKPGGETKLHLTFETRTFTGPYQKSATVGTNDPKHPEFTFAAEGHVYPAVVLYPPDRTIAFSTVSNDSDHSMPVALFSPDRPELKLKKVSSSKPDMIVVHFLPLTDEERTQLKAPKKGNGYHLNVTVKPGLPLGKFREEVVVHTDHPKQPEVRLTVTGKVVGPIAMIPENLRVHNIQSRRGGRAEMLLMVRGSRDTKFEVDKKPEKLEVEIAPTSQDAKAGQYRLTVTIPPGTPPGNISDQIILKTDHPKASVVKIPIEVWVTGPV